MTTEHDPMEFDAAISDANRCLALGYQQAPMTIRALLVGIADLRRQLAELTIDRPKSGQHR